MIIWIAIGCGLKRIFQHPHPILPPMLQDLILAANSDDSQATTLFAILITRLIHGNGRFPEYINGMGWDAS